MSLQADRRRTYVGLLVVAGLCLTFAGCFVVSRSNAPSSTVLIPATPSATSPTPIAPGAANDAPTAQPIPTAAPAPDADDGPSR